MIVFFLILFLYVIEPILFIKKNDPTLPAEIYTFIELNKKNYYYFAIYELIAAIFSSLAGLGYDGIVMCLLNQVYLELEMLKNHLEDVSEYLRSIKGSKSFVENEEKKEFRKIVMEHQNIYQ